MEEKNQKPVPPEAGIKLKNEIGAYSYVECSARTQEGLKSVFQDAIEATMQGREPMKKKKKGPCTIL